MKYIIPQKAGLHVFNKSKLKIKNNKQWKDKIKGLWKKGDRE
jgi:hypothetical protein